MKNNLVAAACCSLFLCATSYAEEQQPTALDHQYKASAELGFLLKTGNNKSGDVKSAFDFEHLYGKWRSTLKASLLYRKSEVAVVDENGNSKDKLNTTDQKITVNSQTNYSFAANGANYMYGSLVYEDDRFSSFEYQTTVSSGWGKKWYETEKASFFADIGPGFKRDRVKGTETEDAENMDAFIIQAQALYKRKINEAVEFKQLVRATQAVDSEDNSVYKAETTLTTKLVKALAIRFSFIVDHNTKVSEDKENTDTQTAITLVYNF
ncbi:DUF481 domain-containing protein [Colwellia sp. MEBiC06753]